MRLGKLFGPRKGGSLLEFTLVGIPALMVLISVCELGRGMWAYCSLDYAINEGARYAVVRGKGCTTGGNSCSTTVSGVVNQITSSGFALSRDNLELLLISKSGTVTCNPVSNCTSNNTIWPPSGDNVPGMDIKISGTYGFKSALSMFWPGAGAVPFAPVYFSAYSRQGMQF
jgi:Flp pilus assembly protein TadG